MLVACCRLVIRVRACARQVIRVRSRLYLSCFLNSCTSITLCVHLNPVAIIKFVVCFICKMPLQFLWTRPDPYLAPLFAQQNQVVNQTTTSMYTVMMQTNTTPLVSKKKTLFMIHYCLLSLIHNARISQKTHGAKPKSQDELFMIYEDHIIWLVFLLYDSIKDTALWTILRHAQSDEWVQNADTYNVLCSASDERI